jgi:hypothetical protein
MDIDGAYGELQRSWQDLSQKWREATSMWNDEIRWQFEGEFWKPLQSQVPMTVVKMENLAKVIAQARHNVHMY